MVRKSIVTSCLSTLCRVFMQIPLFSRLCPSVPNLSRLIFSRQISQKNMKFLKFQNTFKTQLLATFFKFAQIFTEVCKHAQIFFDICYSVPVTRFFLLLFHFLTIHLRHVLLCHPVSKFWQKFQSIWIIIHRVIFFLKIK